MVAQHYDGLGPCICTEVKAERYHLAASSLTLPSTLDAVESFSASAFGRFDFFSWRLAPIGKRFAVSHDLQVTTFTSAQGLRAPRLRFSTTSIDVHEGSRRASHRLQIVYLISFESLI